MTRILIVEDNPDLAFGLRSNLEIEGYDVSIASTGAAGLEQARSQQPDLLILDVMLPEMDGFEVLQNFRASNSSTPVLMLTARGDEFDKVRGLRSGADDYVTKPFGVLELLARVEVLLRRHGVAEAAAETSVQRFGDVEVDAARRMVLRGGEPVDLSPKEFDLLLALLRRRGAVISREDLLQEVWGYSASVVSRTVDTHIAELRRKLEADPSSPRHILTARKAGYRLEC